MKAASHGEKVPITLILDTKNDVNKHLFTPIFNLASCRILLHSKVLSGPFFIISSFSSFYSYHFFVIEKR